MTGWQLKLRGHPSAPARRVMLDTNPPVVHFIRFRRDLMLGQMKDNTIHTSLSIPLGLYRVDSNASTHAPMEFSSPCSLSASGTVHGAEFFTSTLSIPTDPSIPTTPNPTTSTTSTTATATPAATTSRQVRQPPMESSG